MRPRLAAGRLGGERRAGRRAQDERGLRRAAERPLVGRGRRSAVAAGGSTGQTGSRGEQFWGRGREPEPFWECDE